MADENVTDSAVETDDNSENTIENQDTPTVDTSTEKPAKDEPSTDEATDAATEVAPDWPDDWRDKLAKGDEKARKRLDRFQSPADVLKSWQALEQKMSSGDVKSKLPDNATDEQITAYRKDNGIPETFDGYLADLPDGLVIGDDDKDMVNSYLERVHGKNADPSVVQETLNWYYDLQEEQIAAQAESDKSNLRDGEDEIRAEWGAEFRANQNAIRAYGDTMPEGLFETMVQARGPDGRILGHNPDFMRQMARLASEANPAGFVSPAGGGSQVESVKSEIASIEKVMRDDRATYNKDTKMQERLRVLYDAEAKLSA